jgi:hypothetical protein
MLSERRWRRSNESAPDSRPKPEADDHERHAEADRVGGEKERSVADSRSPPASASTDESTGPMHGDHPKPKAAPAIGAAKRSESIEPGMPTHSHD